MLTRLNALRGQPCERGATAVEYALMVTMIALVIIVSVTALGRNLIPFFAQAASSV